MYLATFQLPNNDDVNMFEGKCACTRKKSAWVDDSKVVHSRELVWGVVDDERREDNYNFLKILISFSFPLGFYFCTLSLFESRYCWLGSLLLEALSLHCQSSSHNLKSSSQSFNHGVLPSFKLLFAFFSICSFVLFHCLAHSSAQLEWTFQLSHVFSHTLTLLDASSKAKDLFSLEFACSAATPDPFILQQEAIFFLAHSNEQSSLSPHIFAAWCCFRSLVNGARKCKSCTFPASNRNTLDTLIQHINPQLESNRMHTLIHSLSLAAIFYVFILSNHFISGVQEEES